MGEKLSEKEFDEMVRVADSNGDGRIDYEGKTYLCLFDFLPLSNKKIMNSIFKKCNDHLFKSIKKCQRIKYGVNNKIGLGSGQQYF